MSATVNLVAITGRLGNEIVSNKREKESDLINREEESEEGERKKKKISE